MYDEKQIQALHTVFDPSLPRLGVGNTEITEKALKIIFSKRPELKNKQNLKILDLGCGNGGQTVDIAKKVNAKITAFDIYEPYLNELKRRAKLENVEHKIKVIQTDMFNPVLDDKPYDIIWSEGAVGAMGFENALKMYYEFLTDNGVMAISDCSWIHPLPPEECRKYYYNVYPVMVDIDENISTIKKNGYKLIDYFVLPVDAWEDNMYKPLEKRLDLLRKRNDLTSEVITMVKILDKGIVMFRKYSDYMGTVFYLFEKN
jgi:serine/threonine-protein kinase HipA